MKLNLRSLPYADLLLPEITAIAYETERECSDEDVVDLSHDFNIALYKKEKLLSWVQLCACSENNQIEFRNRFIENNNDCSEINERILNYAEKWAAEQGYKKILVRACEISVPYYLRNQFVQQGEPICEAGNLLYPLIKTL